MSGVNLVQWLGAQLDTDERIAREANTSPEMVTGIPGSYAAAPVALHIAEFASPARVLREIDAKRQALELHRPSEFGTWVGDDDDQAPACRTCGNLTVRFPCRTLRLLALPYEDRPGYQEAWRP